MIRITARSLLAVGLVGACLVGLLACGSAAPTATVAPSAPPTTAPTPIPAAARCNPDPIKFTQAAAKDLTGHYAGDDGGIYYVRQLDSVIWWNGMSNRDGPAAGLGIEWNNVGRGELGKDLIITSDWADVPRGEILGGGTVTFKVGADGAGNLQITKVSETGSGRGDTVWTPCKLQA
jgi:hypothetical protein